MIREPPAMTVRQNLGELLNEVQYRGDRILITKAGRPVAAPIDITLFERLRELDEKFAGTADELARVLSYPKIARRLRWDRARIERFVKQVYLRSATVDPGGLEGAEVPADPDSPLLGTLIAAEAECLVTGDADLLAVRERYPILTAVELVKRR